MTFGLWNANCEVPNVLQIWKEYEKKAEDFKVCVWSRDVNKPLRNWWSRDVNKTLRNEGLCEMRTVKCQTCYRFGKNTRKRRKISTYACDHVMSTNHWCQQTTEKLVITWCQQTTKKRRSGTQFLGGLLSSRDYSTHSLVSSKFLRVFTNQHCMTGISQFAFDSSKR